jgi:hypothetical protein
MHNNYANVVGCTPLNIFQFFLEPVNIKRDHTVWYYLLILRNFCSLDVLKLGEQPI